MAHTLDQIAQSMIVPQSENAGDTGKNTKNTKNSGSPNAPAASSGDAQQNTAEGSSRRAAGEGELLGARPNQRPNNSILDDDDTDDSRNRAVTSDEDDEDFDVADDSDDESAGDDDAKSSDKDKGSDTGDTSEGDDEDYDPLSDALGDADRERDASTDDNDVIDASKLGDDVKLSVTVDGEDQIVTLGDLKRRYAGEGAIEKRLQIATEARTKAVEDYDRATQLTQGVLQQFGQMMFRRTISEPDPALMDQNPAQYVKQKAMYDQESQALAAAQGQLYQLVTQLDQQYQQNRQLQRQQAAQELRRIMPVFNDPVKGQKVKAALIEAAKEIGYTDEQIAACEDPLMFKTVALAARELRRQKGVSAQAAKPVTRSMKKVSNGSGKPVDSAKRQQQAALKKARETGAVDDVAQTMILPQPRRTRAV